MQLDERGKTCPLPVIETKKVLEKSSEGTVVTVLVDNFIAVQNLEKLARQKGLPFSYQKQDELNFQVQIIAGAAVMPGSQTGTAAGAMVNTAQVKTGLATAQADKPLPADKLEAAGEGDIIRKGMVVVLSAGVMGTGDDKLGGLLMKGFVFALTQQDQLPETVLLYNGGAFLSCEGSVSLGDLQNLAQRGVQILTCGTCLNHYHLSEKLQVGTVTNMYEIVQIMTGAALLVRP